jgi:hypothetical protein
MDAYSTERYRLKATQEKELRTMVSGHVQARQQLEAKHKAELDALRAAYAQRGQVKLGRPIRPRPDPEAVRGLWRAGKTAAEMATDLRTTKQHIYQVLSTLPEYHRVWDMLKTGVWLAEIAEELDLPMAAIQAVKLSARKRGHDLSRDARSAQFKGK